MESWLSGGNVRWTLANDGQILKGYGRNLLSTALRKKLNNMESWLSGGNVQWTLANDGQILKGYGRNLLSTALRKKTK